MTDYMNMHKKPTMAYGRPQRPRETRPSPPPAASPSKPDLAFVLLAEDPSIDGTHTPGSAFWREVDGVVHGLNFVCPCGCGDQLWVPVSTGEKQEHRWLWNGSKERPVLSPSILRRGGCGWHGFLGAPDGSKPGTWTTF